MSKDYFHVEGEAYPLPSVFYDIETQDISAAAYAPTTAAYLNRGFFVKPDTAGTVPVITLKSYRENGNSISGLSYVNIYCQQYEWILTPVVAVNTGGSASNINVGLY